MIAFNELLRQSISSCKALFLKKIAVKNTSHTSERVRMKELGFSQMLLKCYVASVGQSDWLYPTV